MQTKPSHLRVLVVEDEYFIAEELANALRSIEAEVVGPARNETEALDLFQREKVDAAVLDINLDGQVSFFLANWLTEWGVPFVFATGYEPATVPPALRSVPLWQKPFDADAIAASLASMMAS